MESQTSQKNSLAMFTVLLVLSLSAMTCSAAQPRSEPIPDLSQFVDSVKDQQRFLIFDIQGKVDAQQLADAFSGITVYYNLRSYGGLRNILVTKYDENDLDGYVNLDLPADVTVDVNPAELWGDYSRYFGVEGREDQELIPMPNKNLLVVEYNLPEAGKSVEEFKANLADIAQEWMGYPDKDEISRVFHLTAHYPVKLLSVQVTPDNVLDRLYLEADTVLGGPSNNPTTVLPVYNSPNQAQSGAVEGRDTNAAPSLLISSKNNNVRE